MTESAVVAAAVDRYRTLFDAAPVSIWDQDATDQLAWLEELRQQGVLDFHAYFAEHPDQAAYGASLARVIDVNTATLQLFEAESKDELFAHVREIMLPETVATFGSALARVAEGQTQFHIIGVLQTLKTRRRIDAIFSWQMDTTGRGIPTGQAIVTIQDITRRMNAERSLKEKERALLMAMECIRTVARADDEAALLQEVCRLIVETGGYRMAWVGYRMDDETHTVKPMAHHGIEDDYVNRIRVSWDDEPTGRGPVGAAIRLGTTITIANVETDERFRPWRDDATQRGYHSVIGLPLLQDGRAFGSLGIYAAKSNSFDKSEQGFLEELVAEIAFGIRSLRERIRQQQTDQELHDAYQKLKNLDRLKGEFLASVSHELRTPLATIQGVTDSILAHKVADFPPDSERMMQMLRRNVVRLNRLIDNLLEHSRLEAGQFNLRLRTIDLREPVLTVLEDLGPAAHRRNVSLVPALPDAKVDASLDPDRVIQIITNLLDNAIRFAEHEVRISMAAVDGHAVLTIEDDGPGIPPDDLPRLFERFSPLKAHGFKSHTGLGLSIVRALVLAHGGEVYAENRFWDGGGSRFTATFPLQATLPE